jgi:hypothetical protein
MRLRSKIVSDMNLKYFLFLFILSYNLKVDSQSININKCYEFINLKNAQDTTKEFNLLDLAKNEGLLRDSISILNDTIFNENDIKYIRKQIAEINRKKYKWETNKINGAKMLKYSLVKRVFSRFGKGWKTLNKKNIKGFVTYSIPIFSVDGKVCIVATSFNCGNQCLVGGVYVYRLKNSKWIYQKSYSRWM